MTDSDLWEGTDLAGEPGRERSARRKLRVTRTSDVKIRAAEWLYDQRIPAGAITLLAGREGIGKSTITYDWIAQVTKGTLPGNCEGTPRSVIVSATEDAWDCVIVPRLVAARADLDRVLMVQAVNLDGTEETVSVPADLERLKEVSARYEVSFMVLDPIMSALHASLDTHKDREVRKGLDPLAAFAADTGVAVVGLIHTNKRETTDPLNSLMASRAFSAVARSVLYAITDPEHEDRYLLGHPKSNLGPKQCSQRYHLVTATVEIPGGEITTSKVVWDGDDPRTTQEILEEGKPSNEGGQAVRQAKRWLTEYLTDQAGGADSETVKKAANDEGISERTLKRAVKVGGILVERSGFPATTFWMLPGNTDEPGHS